MHVVTPGGTAYDSNMRVGQPLDAGVENIPAGHPLHRPRLARRAASRTAGAKEDLVFPDVLPKGTYLIFVDPFAACGRDAVHFTYTVYQSIGKCPACNLQATAKFSGELLASQATGGVTPPTFVGRNSSAMRKGTPP